MIIDIGKFNSIVEILIIEIKYVYEWCENEVRFLILKINKLIKMFKFKKGVIILDYVKDFNS